MANNWAHLANFRKQGLGTLNWEMCHKVIFGKRIGIQKVCGWICHDLKIGILQGFLGQNIVVQSI